MSKPSIIHKAKFTLYMSKTSFEKLLFLFNFIQSNVEKQTNKISFSLLTLRSLLFPTYFNGLKNCNILCLPKFEPTWCEGGKTSLNQCLSWGDWFLLWFETELSYVGLISFEYVFVQKKRWNARKRKKKNRLQYL